MPYKDQNWVEGTKLPPMKKLPPAAWQQPTEQEIPWYQKGYVGEATSTGESLLKTPVVQSVASVGKKLPGWILGRGGAESSQRGAIYGELAQALSAGYPEDPSMRQIGAIGKAGVNFATQTARGRVQQATSTGLKGGKSFAESLALADPRDVSLMGEKTLSDLYAMHMEERRYGEVEKPAAEREAETYGTFTKPTQENELSQAGITLKQLQDGIWEYMPGTKYFVKSGTTETKLIPELDPLTSFIEQQKKFAKLSDIPTEKGGLLTQSARATQYDEMVTNLRKTEQSRFDTLWNINKSYNEGDPRIQTLAEVDADALKYHQKNMDYIDALINRDFAKTGSILQSLKDEDTGGGGAGGYSAAQLKDMTPEQAEKLNPEAYFRYLSLQSTGK